MLLVQFLWFMALLAIAMAVFRLLQVYAGADSSIGKAIAFLLH